MVNPMLKKTKYSVWLHLMNRMQGKITT